MRWLIDTNGNTSGPMDDAMVAALVKAGEIGAGSLFREETGTAWLGFDQTPFAYIAKASQPPAQPAAPAAVIESSGAGGRIFAALVLGGVSFFAVTAWIGFGAGVLAGLGGVLLGIIAGGIKL